MEAKKHVASVSKKKPKGESIRFESQEGTSFIYGDFLLRLLRTVAALAAAKDNGLGKQPGVIDVDQDFFTGAAQKPDVPGSNYCWRRRY